MKGRPKGKKTLWPSHSNQHLHPNAIYQSFLELGKVPSHRSNLDQFLILKSAQTAWDSAHPSRRVGQAPTSLCCAKSGELTRIQGNPFQLCAVTTRVSNKRGGAPQQLASLRRRRWRQHAWLTAPDQDRSGDKMSGQDRNFGEADLHEETPSNDAQGTTKISNKMAVPPSSWQWCWRKRTHADDRWMTAPDRSRNWTKLKGHDGSRSQLTACLEKR